MFLENHRSSFHDSLIVASMMPSAWIPVNATNSGDTTRRERLRVGRFLVAGWLARCGGGEHSALLLVHDI